MNQSKVVYSVLLVFLYLVGGKCSGDGPVDEIARRTLHEMLFDPRIPPIEETMTVKYIEDLYKLYEGKSLDDGWGSNYAELYDATKVTPTKCSAQSMKARNDLLDKEKYWTKNVVPMLESYKIKQYKACKEDWIGKIDAALAKLGPKQAELNSLVAGTVASYRIIQVGHLMLNDTIGMDTISNGVMKFMKEKGIFPSRKQAMANASMLSKMYDDRVLPLCQAVQAEYLEPIELYERFTWSIDRAGSAKFYLELDQKERELLLAHRICARIVENRILISDHLLLMAKKPTVVEKIKFCFGNWCRKSNSQ